MYNKISSIILNSGKSNGFSDVYIAQPDSFKEGLAGKMFIIAEIGAKKNEGRRIMDFLVSNIDENYYDDEKILLRDKIEGLKIEKIFEAVVAKINKNLNDFLIKEKIKLSVPATHITLGVIFENKLYFTNFGKNKALLIYRHGEQFEIINVETNAYEVKNSVNPNEDRADFKAPSIFSSVISGEIPISSYFVFTNEALPEYISNQDMINIITKLPPIVAAEQIKNVLGKINSFIPFLGIIIKNTIGDNQEMREETEQSLSAHGSISSLNYTEKKTERMLAPAGLINFSDICRGFKQFIEKIKPKAKALPKKVYRPAEEKEETAKTVNLDKVNTMNNMVRADSFLIKEQIIFKKRPSQIGAKFKKILTSLSGIFHTNLFTNLTSKIKDRFAQMEKRNRRLFLVLILLIIIFTGSLTITSIHKKRETAKVEYSNLVSAISEKQAYIDSLILYDNEKDAKKTLIEISELLATLPKEKDDQKIIYDRFNNTFNNQADKIQKIVRIDEPEKVNDLSGLAVSNLIWANDKLYAAGGKMIYSIMPGNLESSRLEVNNVTNLSNPRFDRKGFIYYWADGKIVKYNLKNNQADVTELDAGTSLEEKVIYDIFNNGRNTYLYILAKNQNQIFRYSYNTGAKKYDSKSDWLKENVDLSQVVDISIDGSIYTLNDNGEVSKFHLYKKEDYLTTAISPEMSADKIIVGTNYLYLFDAESKRLAVLAIKDGHLMNQYQVDSLSPVDFAVDEKNKTAYFLADELIYKISLKQ
ncbi:hypothetical protein GX917_00715 [Candidatus Falkowbacteria bacterium]|jgi:hypothetical protein|nr:hypothetical protein [Candidatus Falkowbacteria bacterium]